MYVMTAVVFVSLFASLVLIPVAFIYPFAYIALFLQLLFTLLAFMNYRKKKEKGSGSGLAVTFTALHGLNLVLIASVFFFIALPSAESGDLHQMGEGITKIVRKALGLPPVNKKTSETEQSQSLDEIGGQDESGVDDADKKAITNPGVEDPF